MIQGEAAPILNTVGESPLLYEELSNRSLLKRGPYIPLLGIISKNLAQEEKNAGELVCFQGSPPPSSNIVHPVLQKIKQRWKDICTVEKQEPDKTQNAKKEAQKKWKHGRIFKKNQTSPSIHVWV